MYMAFTMFLKMLIVCLNTTFANDTTHQLLTCQTNIPISCLFTVFKCPSKCLNWLISVKAIRWKALVASSKYYVVRHRFTSMSQLSNTREFISNLDFRQLCQIYCFISFDFFPHRLFNCLRFSEQQHFLREVMIIREIVLIVQIDSANWLHRQRPVHIQPDHRRGGGELSHGRLCSLWKVLAWAGTAA